MNLDIRSTPDGVLVGLDGSLTGADAAAFADRFKSEVPEGSVATLDFSGVKTVDIEGLRKLITVDRWLKGRGGKLVLSAVSDEVNGLLKSNGVEGMFEIVRHAPAAPRREAAVNPPPPEPAPSVAPPAPQPAAPPAVEPSAWERPAAPARSPERPVRPTPPPEAPASEPGAWDPPPARATRTASRAPAGPPPSAPVPEDAWSAMPPAAPSPEPLSQRAPAVSPPGRVPDLREDTSAWSTPGTTAPEAGAKPQRKPAAGGGGAPRWLVPAALIIVLGGAAAWWFGFRKSDPPAISSIFPGLDVILEPGTPADFRIDAINADAITAEGARLPGLEFRSSALAGAATAAYTGEVASANASGPLTVTFTPRRGDLAGQPTTISFSIRTPLLFEQTEFRTEAGKTFSGRVVSGASSCRVDPKPPWLSLGSEQSAGRTVWNVGGTPPAAGTTTLTVFATDVSGREEQKTITLNVTEPVAVAPPVTPPVTTPPPDREPDIPPVIASPPPPKGEVPEKLRRMIRARMDAMSARRLSPAMRIQINNGLDNMESAAVVAAVGFASNSSSLDPRSEALIERRLADPDIKPLLDSPRRQLIVIGYASPKGSADHNLALSRARAETVAAFLNSRGYRPRFSDGYGETRIVGEDAGSNQAVEIYLVVPTEGYVDPMEELANQLERLRSLMKAEEAK